MQEAEAETTKFREAAEAFEPIKQYPRPRQAVGHHAGQGAGAVRRL